MSILETLKGAKNFLNTGKDREKTPCICYAITDYVASVYGRGQVYAQGSEAYLMREAAQSYVMYKLQDLTPECVFDSRATSTVLGIPQHRLVDEYFQLARHLWLDSLIKELENENN